MKEVNAAGLAQVLESLAIDSDKLLGQGGESWVFALENDRIARINRPGSKLAQVNGRTALLSELALSIDKVPFSIPVILDTLIVEKHIITIERRLPGRPLIQALAESTGAARESMIFAYLETAAQLGNFVVDRPWFGDLIDTNAIRTASFHDYLEQRAAQSRRTAGREFDTINPEKLAAALPEPEKPALVHLDAYPGNMLADGDAISAVLDFGVTSIIGDGRLNPLTAAIYLDQSITPTSTSSDRALAQEWLRDHGLIELYGAVTDWIAAYWSFATDDLNLHRWCQGILLTAHGKKTGALYPF